MQYGNTEVPLDPGAPCVHAPTCHHFRQESKPNRVMAMAGYKLFEDGTIGYIQWGDMAGLEQAMRTKCLEQAQRAK